jgi:hypothetical protein
VSHEYNLRVGNAVITLGFRRRGDRDAFIEYFGRPSLPDRGALILDIRFENCIKGLKEISNSLFLTKKGDGDGFTAGDGLIRGRFSPSSGEGELVVQRIITEGSFMRVFEQILYQAYWSAVRKSGLDSFLLHSSSIIRGGRGYVFTGKSGSGKSTVASLCSGDHVLNDEITTIDLGSRPAVIRDTPFNGFFGAKREGSAPAAGIFLLKQAPRHRVERTRTAESVKTLSKELIPPMGLETPLSPKVYWEMLDYAARAAEAVAVYDMEFLPDPGFWSSIEQAEREGR